MIESILKSFEVWTDAQGVKSKARVKSIDNISLEGVSLLRELILDLAIRGKLVSQIDNDEPATEKIHSFFALKAQLIHEKELKKTNSLPNVPENEYPFELPIGWAIEHLQNISLLITKGSTPCWRKVNFFH